MDGSPNKNQSIRQYSITDEEFKQITIAPRVIDQITNSTTKKKSNKRWTAVPVILIFCVCIASVTTYATAEFVQIYNKKGDIVVETHPLKHNSYGSVESDRRIQKPEAKPGELIAYYPNQDELRPYLGPTKILYEYNPVKYNDITEFYKKAKSTNAPDVIQPSYLPKGYTFHFATIWPEYPSAGDGEGSEYDKLVRTLSLKAKETNERIIPTETLHWTRSSGAHLYFSTQNEPNSLTVIASYGLKLDASQPAGATSRKIKIGTQEALIMQDPSNTYFNTKIAWYDESTSTVYFMEDSASEALSEEEMVKMADSLIHAK